MKIQRLSTFAALLVVSLSGSAVAEEKGGIITDLGVTFGVGGGVTDFTGEEMRDMTGTAGTWDARLVVGTHKLVGIEAGYVGSLQSIDALGMESDARLVSTGVDAAVRVHFLPGEFQPYAFAGAGWRRYDVTNTNTNTSSMADSDDLLEIPVGVGVAYTFKHFNLDVRGSYRPTFDNDMVAGATRDDERPTLDTFQVTGRIGWEF
jgi:hypothetical protein